ncbi:hypothetical protein DRQ09_01340 [candidate division KSB1 bacterium]|nr:MAG: hypothetical protein DRQ09_01340 [candidate division KSB1 bacterium]
MKSVSKFCSALFLTIITIFFCFSLLYGQDAEYYLRLYENNRIDDLKNILKNKPAHKEEISIIFLKALLEEDAELAYNNFLRLSNLSSLYGEFSNLRLAQYNYAKGNYKKALEILNDFLKKYPESRYKNKINNLLKLTEKAIETNPSQKSSVEALQEKRFVIQLGAFAIKDNAQKRLNYLKKKGLNNIYIKIKEVLGKKWYSIQLQQVMTKENAKKKGEELKNKFGISCIIVEK